MENKPPTSSVISAYRKRRQRTNIIFVYGAAGLLVLAGLILLIVWLASPSQPLGSLFATKTPTPTVTFTPTLTPLTDGYTDHHTNRHCNLNSYSFIPILVHGSRGRYAR